MNRLIWLLPPILLMVLSAACRLGEPTRQDSSASADVWLDQDADGVKDSEDIPIEDVCIWATTQPQTYNQIVVENYCRYPDLKHETHTDETGHTPGREAAGGHLFFAGAACRDVYIFVVLPEGYDLSTPGQVNNCYASYGLVTTTP